MTSDRLVFYLIRSKTIQSRNMLSIGQCDFFFPLSLCFCMHVCVYEAMGYLKAFPFWQQVTNKIKSNFKRTNAKTYNLCISDTSVSDSLTCFIQNSSLKVLSPLSSICSTLSPFQLLIPLIISSWLSWVFSDFFLIKYFPVQDFWLKQHKFLYNSVLENASYVFSVYAEYIKASLNFEKLLFLKVGMPERIIMYLIK